MPNSSQNATPEPAGIAARKSRSEATQTALMDAAEKLIAQHGIENVSIRDIVAGARQKNESALQYHFKNLTGLINAIHKRRSSQTRERRAELLQALLLNSPQPSVRELCTAMVRPSYELARSHIAYRRYIKAFGHLLMLTESSALDAVSQLGGGGASGQQIGELLKHALPELSAASYQRRMDTAVRLCSASMYHHARQPNAFRGESAELFFHSLLDALVGLLTAQESRVTKDLARRLDKPSSPK